jgi:hypothetical protein
LTICVEGFVIRPGLGSWCLGFVVNAHAAHKSCLLSRSSQPDSAFHHPCLLPGRCAAVREIKGQLASAIPFIIGFICFPGTHCCVCEDVSQLKSCREPTSVLPGAALHHMGVEEGFTFRQSFVSTELCGWFSCYVCLSPKCVQIHCTHQGWCLRFEQAV